MGENDKKLEQCFVGLCKSLFTALIIAALGKDAVLLYVFFSLVCFLLMFHYANNETDKKEQAEEDHFSSPYCGA